jgi:hypothetical protein
MPLALCRTFVAVVLAAHAACIVPRSDAADPPSTHKLGVDGTRFTVDGKPVFLLGCSYYAGLGASDEMWRADLDDMQKAGINWIRVWATWAAFGNDVSAVDGEGRPRQPYLDRLKQLVAECDRRGLIVDVSLSRGNGVTGPSRLAKLDTHRRAVETIVEAIKPHGNWYLDLANERNIGDDRFVSFDDLKVLRTRVRELDPTRLVTASHGGDIGDDELRKYLEKAGVDIVTPHRPRHEKSPAETEVATRKLLASMKKLGRVVPVHHQEPFRRAYNYAPGVDDFATDLRGALAGGAAGWCFHNGDTRGKKDGRPRRSFDLANERLFEQLDDVERKAVPRFKSIVDDARDKAPQ